MKRKSNAYIFEEERFGCGESRRSFVLFVYLEYKDYLTFGYLDSWFLRDGVF